MPLFRRYEHEIARSDRAHALFRFHRRLAVDDEIEMLAIGVIVIRRRRARFVVHHARQHIVDVREFLIDEKGAFAPRHDRYERR